MFFTYIIIISLYSLELPAFTCLDTIIAHLYFYGGEVLLNVCFSTGTYSGLGLFFIILEVRHIIVNKKKTTTH
jgi:hypothetical protein